MKEIVLNDNEKIDINEIIKKKSDLFRPGNLF